MLFKDIIAQQETKQHLIELVRNNRLSHALLFLSKEGSGALSLAMALAGLTSLPPFQQKGSGAAASLFDDESSASASEQLPAGIEEVDHWMQKQPAWSKIKDLVHPDIHFSYPVITKKPGTPPISTDYITEWREFIKSNPYGNVYDWLQFIGAENKQGNITAHECNDIIRKLNLKSFESEYKILILWMPEYLGNEGNKLLKLIEEPPPNTLFILVAENETLILPTIVSRCQLIKIPSLSTADIEKALVERNKIEPGIARQIAGITEGSYREALQSLQHAEEDWQGFLRDWLNAMLKTGPVAQARWVEDISRVGREKQKQFLGYFNHLLEQAIRLRINGQEGNNGINIPEKEMDFALRLNKVADIAQQRAIITEIDNAAYYIERNANAKILFHALTIKLYHIIQDKIVFLNT